MSAEELIARGYRRISNKYGAVARIDRPDWVEHMARVTRRAPADFYTRNPDGTLTTVSATWADHYRRCISEDVLTLDPPSEARAIPSSMESCTEFMP